MSKFARMCLVFFALCLALIGMAQAGETPERPEQYTVKKGDWLAKIARKFGYTDYMTIANANKLADPNVITIGQKLTLPAEDKARTVVRNNEPKTKTEARNADTCTQDATPLEVGIASWYGHPYHGRKTASGETYDMNDMTVAHPTLPLGTKVCITSNKNGRSVVAKVNDRGPFIKPRIIDLSKRIAEVLGIVESGLGMVRVTVLEYATARPSRITRVAYHETRLQRQEIAQSAPRRHVLIDSAAVNTAVPPRNTLGYVDTKGRLDATTSPPSEYDLVMRLVTNEVVMTGNGPVHVRDGMTPNNIDAASAIERLFANAPEQVRSVLQDRFSNQDSVAVFLKTGDRMQRMLTPDRIYENVLEAPQSGSDIPARCYAFLDQTSRIEHVLIREERSGNWYAEEFTSDQEGQACTRERSALYGTETHAIAPIGAD